DQLDAEADELELLHQAGSEREEQRGADVVAAAGQDLSSARHAAHVVVLLEADDAQAALGEEGGGGQAVVARPDDDGIDFLHGPPLFPRVPDGLPHRRLLRPARREREYSRRRREGAHSTRALSRAGRTRSARDIRWTCAGASCWAAAWRAP